MKDIIITPPDGYEIDTENSTFECIKFKPKKALTYYDIANELFLDKEAYFIGTNGNIVSMHLQDCTCSELNNSVTRTQCRRLLAINQLMNVACYFNEIVDKDVDYSTYRYIPYVEETTGRLKVFSDTTPFIKMGIVSFKTKKSAEKAIQILGEDTIILAICM